MSIVVNKNVQLQLIGPKYLLVVPCVVVIATVSSVFPSDLDPRDVVHGKNNSSTTNNGCFYNKND